MAVAGVIWAPDGRVLFDTRWPQMVLVAKGRITASGQTANLNGGRNPIIAYRPVNCSAAVVTESRSGSNFGFNFGIYNPSTGYYVDYWIYDRVPPQKPTSGVSLALFDESGNTTFRADVTPMVVAPGAVEPAGRTYAIAPSVGPYWREDVNIDINTEGIPVTQRLTEIGGWRYGGGGFYIDPRPTNDHFGLNSDGAYDPSLSYWVILDVTNH